MSSLSHVKRTLSVIVAGYPGMEGKESMGPFLALAEKALSKYPEHVLDRLADPRSGIVTRNSFIPSIADMCAFCEKETTDEWRKAVTREQLQAQLSAPRQFESEIRRERMKAKFADLLAELANAPDKWANEGVFRRKGDEWIAREKKRKAIEWRDSHPIAS